MNEQAVFSYLVATARHSLSRAGLEPFDAVAVVVDSLGAGHGRLIALGRDGRSCAHVADVLAEAVAGVAAIGHDPARHTG